MDAHWTRRDRTPWPARLLALGIALLVTGPALGPGFVLLRDMVFVPRQDLDLDALGLGGGLPRAVPVDAVMALLTTVVPGDLLQKAVLLGLVYAAVLGAARLVPPDADGRRGLAGAVAGLVYGWSPYLAERLLIGQWTLLRRLGGAALDRPRRPSRAGRASRAPCPCSSSRASRPRSPRPGRCSPRGSCWPSPGSAAAPSRSPPSSSWPCRGSSPARCSPAGGTSDPAGVAAFAARAENWGGTLLAVLGTGGIWNAGAVPPGRGSALVPVVTLLLLALAVFGWLTRDALRGAGRGLVVLGAVGIVLACAGRRPGGRRPARGRRAHRAGRGDAARRAEVGRLVRRCRSPWAPVWARAGSPTPCAAAASPSSPDRSPVPRCCSR